MVSSKRGRLLVAAGLPVAAAGLTLVAGGSASAASVTLPVAHVVKITTDGPCCGHATALSTPGHTPEHVHPVFLTEVDTVRPVVTTTVPTPQTHPGHVIPGHVIPGHVIPGHVIPGHAIPARPTPQHPAPQHGMVDTLEIEKHEGAGIHVVHQTVTVKIETTGFTVVAHQGSE